MSLLTEEKAPTMRCCGPDDCGEWRTTDKTTNNGDRFCIGSDCMAWRWEGMTWSGEPFRRVEGDRQLGYCGLAGPQRSDHL